MDYGPAGGRQEGSDCGQDVALQKGLNQLNSSSALNLDTTASGMPVLPLLPPRVPYSSSSLSHFILFACFNMFPLLDDELYEGKDHSCIVYCFILAPYHSASHINVCWTVDGGRSQERLKYQRTLSVRSVSEWLLQSQACRAGGSGEGHIRLSNVWSYYVRP